MSGVAFVFPGQGSQSVGMAHRVADAFPSAAQAFATADATLAEPLTRLAWDGPAEELDLTVNAQPALLAASIAFLRALQAARSAAAVPPLVPAFHAGHSMGQYSALVAAGVIDLDAGLRLVRERGRQMQAAGGDGAMAAIIGLDDARLPELVRAGQAHGVFTVANRNSPGQIVVSGERAAVEAAVEAAQGLGAKRAIVLPVSVAAHSPAHGARRRRHAAGPGRRHLRRSECAAAGQCRRAPADHRRGLPQRARRAPHPRRRLGARRRRHARGRRRRRSSRSAPARS